MTEIFETFAFAALILGQFLAVLYLTGARERAPSGGPRGGMERGPDRALARLLHCPRKLVAIRP
jgi:hypothetical protein